MLYGSQDMGSVDNHLSSVGMVVTGIQILLNTTPGLKSHKHQQVLAKQKQRSKSTTAIAVGKRTAAIDF